MYKLYVLLREDQQKCLKAKAKYFVCALPGNTAIFVYNMVESEEVFMLKLWC